MLIADTTATSIIIIDIKTIIYITITITTITNNIITFIITFTFITSAITNIATTFTIITKTIVADTFITTANANSISAAYSITSTRERLHILLILVLFNLNSILTLEKTGSTLRR